MCPGSTPRSRRPCTGEAGSGDRDRGPASRGPPVGLTRGDRRRTVVGVPVAWARRPRCRWRWSTVTFDRAGARRNGDREAESATGHVTKCRRWSRSRRPWRPVKPVPVTVTVLVPPGPVVRADRGDRRCRVVGVLVARALTAEVPLAVVTVTSTVPVPAGAVTVSVCRRWSR